MIALSLVSFVFQLTRAAFFSHPFTFLHLSCLHLSHYFFSVSTVVPSARPPNASVVFVFTLVLILDFFLACVRVSTLLPQLDQYHILASSVSSRKRKKKPHTLRAIRFVACLVFWIHWING